MNGNYEDGYQDGRAAGFDAGLDVGYTSGRREATRAICKQLRSWLFDNHDDLTLEDLIDELESVS